ncbi:MAG TPA: Flp pilus assembly protein CpaB, partial [Polyangiales bacterium]
PMHIRSSRWALAIGLPAALLSLWGVARPAGTLRPVLVVTRDLGPGTAITRAVLDFRDLPEPYVEERHIGAEDVERLIGARTTTAVTSGASLLWTDVATGDPERTLASLVPVGMRALTVPAQDLDGALRAGDRVDVLFTPHAPPRGAPDDARTSMLLENALVLGLIHASGGQGAVAQVALSVSPRDAQRVAHGEGRGTLRIALRNPHDVALTEVFADAQEGP